MLYVDTSTSKTSFLAGPAGIAASSETSVGEQLGKLESQKDKGLISASEHESRPAEMPKEV
jgi:hypothetical protein